MVKVDAGRESRDVSGLGAGGRRQSDCRPRRMVAVQDLHRRYAGDLQGPRLRSQVVDDRPRARQGLVERVEADLLILDFNKTVKKPFYYAAFQRSAA